MQGVILWCDPYKGKAVIWCEDHGHLAFYNDANCQSIPFAFVVGDFVIFEQDQRDGLRYALNMRLVSAQEFPTLADQLGTVSKPKNPPVSVVPMPREDTGHVIVFSRKKNAKGLLWRN